MGTPNAKLTYEDFVQFPDDRLRRQIIGGELYVLTSPNTRHQRLVGRLLFSVGNHLKTHGGGEVYPPRTVVVLSPEDVVQPDVIFVSVADSHHIVEFGIQGPPTVAVEVVCNRELDMRIKRDLYARFGVPEYWAADPDLDRIEVYRLGRSGYGKPEILQPGDMLTTTLLPGLEIDVTDLFRR
jgi:Uma2 family endonuclease